MNNAESHMNLQKDSMNLYIISNLQGIRLSKHHYNFFLFELRH